jgi:hypothetical protein
MVLSRKEGVYVCLLLVPVACLNIQAAVVVPGFLTGANDFKELCAELTAEGIPTLAVPMPSWHWIPCLGGRSARPIMERIDHTVQHLIANRGDVSKIPAFDYSAGDCWQDFWTNPGGAAEVGGSSEVDEYPVVEPCGRFDLPKLGENDVNVKVALIGHSAGGWISRAYLSGRNYGGKTYSGSRFIHSLVTLGTPHEVAPGPAFSGIRWVDREDASVRSLAVAGSGFASDEWGTFTQGAYQFCGYEEADGDGVTPLPSAVGFHGAEQLVLPGVHHIAWSDTFGGSAVSKELTEDHRSGKPWYGSKDIVQQWSPFLKAK